MSARKVVIHHQVGGRPNWLKLALAWVEEGKLVAPPVTHFPLDQVAEAHRALESGTTVGKLVLVP